MWHIKFKVTLFSMLICQVLLLAGMGISVMFGVLVGLLPLFALPLWVVKTKNPRLFWWLGLKGPQFWMDKVRTSIHTTTPRLRPSPRLASHSPCFLW